ncbi:MAG: hypothetical protein QXU18_09270 [Thermoplasmatales archaeon]
MEIGDLRSLVDHQPLVKDALKKSTGEVGMMDVEGLKPEISISRISRAMDI